MRVLVTDDDASIRAALRKILQAVGHDVLLAENGKEAIANLSANSADLLLLDLEMPKSDGWDVLDHLTARAISIPVIVITGRTHELYTKTIPGTNALLEKPVEADLLLQKISDLLASTPRRLAPANSQAPPTALESSRRPGKRTN
jgi:DNA-binding response OmpR family regulator